MASHPISWVMNQLPYRHNPGLIYPHFLYTNVKVEVYVKLEDNCSKICFSLIYLPIAYLHPQLIGMLMAPSHLESK